MIKFYQQTNVNFFERLKQFSNLFHFHFFLFKIKTPGKHLSFTHAMYTPEKSSHGFKGMKNQIIIFTQFSTIELAINVALQETLPTITLSQ